jgi:hypothetical protein
MSTFRSNLKKLALRHVHESYASYYRTAEGYRSRITVEISGSSRQAFINVKSNASKVSILIFQNRVDVDKLEHDWYCTYVDDKIVEDFYLKGRQLRRVRRVIDKMKAGLRDKQYKKFFGIDN